MKILYKTPGDKGFRELVVPNQLRVLQDLVGGYIETVTIAEDAAIICNEDGRIIQQEYNCEFCGVNFVGPILIVGIDGEEFCDCPLSVVMANMMAIGSV